MFKGMRMLLMGLLLAIIMTPLFVKGINHPVEQEPDEATKIRGTEACDSYY